MRTFIVAVFVFHDAIVDVVKDIFPSMESSVREIFGNEPGTLGNPYDWSTPERQIANADIPSGAYVKTASGNVCVAKDSEIAWAKQQSVLPTIARFRVNRTSRLYPSVIDYDKLYNTPLEKYIPDMEKRYREIRDTKGVAWQTMRARYANGGETVQYVAHVKLLPGWHNDDGLNEYEYVCKWQNNGDLSDYGAYQKYRTREFLEKLAFDSKRRLSTDNAYAQVVTAALQICDTMDYDWAGFSAYKGTRPIPAPDKKLAVCAGYAETGQSAFLKLPCVDSVENWSVPGEHEWNVLNLTDGRRLFVDVTWFDNDHIDEKTSKTTYADDYDWQNITFDEDLFNHGGIAYGNGEFTHALPSRKLASRVVR